MHEWVSLRVQLGHVPGPFHHQVPPPHSSNIWKKSESPSRQLRRARRYAERKAAAAVAPLIEAVKESSQDITDKQPSKNSDVVEIVDKEETVKEALQHENEAKFHELVDKDKSTEQVDARNSVKQD